jgi:hypothetical protein
MLRLEKSDLFRSTGVRSYSPVDLVAAAPSILERNFSKDVEKRHGSMAAESFLPRRRIKSVRKKRHQRAAGFSPAFRPTGNSKRCAEINPVVGFF